MDYRVPDEFVGMTLSQIRSKYNLSFRPDIVASWGGVKENTPLTAGMTFSAPNDPGSAEVRFLEGDSGYGAVAFKSGATSVVDEVLDAADKQIQEEMKYVQETFGDNPFAFDEASAREAATAEYEPYYSEMLKDYLEDIQTQRESVAGEQKLLNQLRESDVGSLTRNYTQAVDAANKGFAGRGMFFSGTRARNVGETQVDYLDELARSGNIYKFQGEELGRKLGTLETEEERKRRDIFGGDVSLGGLAKYGERQGEYQTALEGGIEQRRQEQQKAYYEPLIQSYFRKYPTSSGNALAGYVPLDYLSY